ncbi:mechanosensitive ion channel family protein [Granulosicoccus sp. 3-233]|uniref:mechanosensitive ion channel family protein n=1 Tax=Granulosicoccus sp. 3-233 TaxID=3417969 RepID=UPI003D33A2F1
MKLLIVRVLMLLLSLAAPIASGDVIDDLLGQESAAEADVEPGSIEVENDVRSDDAIRQRLQGIYAELEALEGVTVSVSNGVVTLGGVVVSAQSGERASRLAAQVVGVIEVVDEMTVDTDVTRRVESTVERLQAILYNFIGSLPILLLALSVIALFWWAGRRAGGHRRLFLLIAPNGFIAELLATLTRILLTVAGLVLALTLLDATSILGSVLGAAGIVGLAIGFAVRDTVENFIASILLSLRTPFLARDHVRIGEHEGAVARLTSRATILISRDGNHVRVPNAIVYKSVIVNYTRQPERRFEFTVGVDTDLDLNRAQQTAINAIQRVDGVLSSPAPAALIKELGDSSVSLLVAAWIDQTRSDLMKVRSEAIREVKQAFDSAGIVMPEPIYRVHLREGWGKPILSQDAPPEVLPESQSVAREAGVIGRDVVSDTTVDQAIQQTIDRELAESDSENLLAGKSRQE